jgi:hypothetical protein
MSFLHLYRPVECAPFATHESAWLIIRPLQSFAVVGEYCGLRNRPQSAPTRSAMASAEEPAGLRTAKFRRYTLSFDNVL